MPEPLRVEGQFCPVNERANAIFLRFRSVLFFVELFNPPRTFLCFFKVKQSRIQDAFGIDFAEVGFDDLGARIEFLQRATENAKVLLRHQIDFVQNDDVGKLDLVCEQVDDGSVVPFNVCEFSILQRFWAPKVVEEVGGIDHRHHGVHVTECTEVNSVVLVHKRKGLGHGNGLADARAFDEQVIKSLLSSKAFDFFHKVLAERATNASVAHFHKLFLGA